METTIWKEMLWGACVAGGIVAVLGTLYLLALNNIFFAFVREGTAKAIRKFGEFQRIILSYKGYVLDEEWDVKSVGKVGEVKAGDIALRPKGFHIGGLYWVGIPFIHDVHRYRFRWTSFAQKEEGGKLAQETVTHYEEIDYVLLQDDIYYTFIREAEAKGMVPVDLELLLTIRVVNPYKALFRVQEWLEMTQNLLMPALREFAGTRTYEELVKVRSQTEREQDIILALGGVGSYIEKDYGVRVKHARLKDVNPSGERAKVYEEAATKEWQAQKEAERIKVLADAEAGRVAKEFGAVKDLGPDGLFIRTLEALETAGGGPSNVVVFPLGALKDILGSWTGGKEGKK